MRTRTVRFVGALLLIFPAIAGGQQNAPSVSEQRPAPVATQPAPTAPQLATGGNLGHVDVGFRADDISGDAARYNRFRDLRQGAFVDRFRLDKSTDSWAFLGEAHNVGYRDQRYFAEFQSFGRVKAAFAWDEIPLFISGDTSSLQTNSGNGVLSIDDTVQKGIQAGSLTLANAMVSAIPFNMKSQRNVGAGSFTYTLNRDVDVIVKVKNTARNGYHLQSLALLNSPGGGISQELGIPTDTRTTDVKAAIEFANRRGMASVGMDASWFDNSIPVVEFDNPLRFTDISAGPSTGRAPMWPSNSRVSFVANGAYRLPGKTRATAAISIGRADSNEPMVPPTSNTVLVAPPLERATTEARADIVSMVYGLNAKPAENLWLNARYRFYDYANKTPLFETVPIVGDWAVGTGIWETEPLSVRRNSVDLDASYSAGSYLAFGAGYSRDDFERSYRIFEKTAEDTFRVSVDSTGSPYVTLRLKYEFAKRTGSGFDEALLEEVSEQPDTRHFDIADRDRSRVTGLVTVTPAAWLNLNGSIGVGHDDYRNTGFGLRDNKSRTYSGGFDLMPAATISLGANYQHERYSVNQYSRTAAPPGTASGPNEFYDSRRDWWLDTNDHVSTVSASLDFLKTIPKTDIRLSYDLSDGEATYVHGTKPDAPRVTTPGVETAVPIPLPLAPVRNRLTMGRADAQYFIRSNVAIGAAYWYERYAVDDFALNPTTINTLAIGTSTVYSGYLYRPYTAHTAWLRVSYLW